MKFETPLLRGTLIKRYKRFLADVQLEDGSIVTAHCANPGAMLGINKPDSVVWLEPNDNPKRKLKFSWKLSEIADGHMVGVDTSLPNTLVAEALAAKHFETLVQYSTIKPEVKYGENSRIDFLLTGAGLQDCYLEIKNVHLCRQTGLAEFPDCETKRGAKHMDELAKVAQAGQRAIVMYIVQRTDCNRFSIADDLDPKYFEAYKSAKSSGVETLCYGTNISLQGISIADALPLDL